MQEEPSTSSSSPCSSSSSSSSREPSPLTPPHPPFITTPSGASSGTYCTVQIGFTRVDASDPPTKHSLDRRRQKDGDGEGGRAAAKHTGGCCSVPIYVQRHIERFFGWLGHHIALSPVVCILASILVCLLALGLLRCRFSEKLEEGFVAYDSRANLERAARKAFMPGTKSWTEYSQPSVQGRGTVEEQTVERKGSWFMVFIQRLDHGSFLNASEARKVQEIRRFIAHNITAQLDNTRFMYQDICLEACNFNAGFDAYEQCLDLLESGKKTACFIDHPAMKTHTDIDLPIGHHLYHVQRLADDERKKADLKLTYGPNGSLTKTLDWEMHNFRPAYPSSNLTDVRLVALYFMANVHSDDDSARVSAWQAAVFSWANGQTEFPDYEISVIGDKVLSSEMVAGGYAIFPHLGFGFACLLIYVAATVTVPAIVKRRLSWRLFAVIIAMLFPPILAALSTFGIVGLLDQPLYPTLMVIPMVIEAIGVDNAFILWHAWRARLKDLHRLYRTESLSATLSHVFREFGPSISISSLTNALAFGIGAIQGTPAMRLFCLVTSGAVIFSFALQLVVFGVVLVWTEKWEGKRCPSLSMDDEGTATTTSEEEYEKKRGFGADATARVRRKAKSVWAALTSPLRSIVKRPLLEVYSRWITWMPIQLFLFVVVVAYFGFNVMYAMRMETRIDSKSIIPRASHLQRANEIMEDTVVKDFEPAYIVIQRAPDLLNSTDVALFKTMMSDFEGLERNIGPRATISPLKAFFMWHAAFYGSASKLVAMFASDGYPSEPTNYDDMPFFLERSGDIGKFFKSYVAGHTDEKGRYHLDSFHFVSAFHNATSWMQRVQNMQQWRHIADTSGAPFKMSVWTDASPVLEAILELEHTIKWTLLWSVLAMILVCALFIPSVAGVVVAGASVCSISVGVLGGLSWFGFDLDPVTAAAILMAIGMSVDYTAHTVYHFVRRRHVLPKGTPVARHVEDTIRAVGVPMWHAAWSTALVFLPSLTHADYTPQVFVTSILFVVGLSFVHGIVVLPAILSLLPDALFDWGDGIAADCGPRSLPLLLEEGHLGAPDDKGEKPRSDSKRMSKRSNRVEEEESASNDTSVTLLPKEDDATAAP